jgi:hypothetical protein
VPYVGESLQLEPPETGLAEELRDFLSMNSFFQLGKDYNEQRKKLWTNHQASFLSFKGIWSCNEKGIWSCNETVQELPFVNFIV